MSAGVSKDTPTVRVPAVSEFKWKTLDRFVNDKTRLLIVSDVLTGHRNLIGPNYLGNKKISWGNKIFSLSLYRRQYVCFPIFLTPSLFVAWFITRTTNIQGTIWFRCYCYISIPCFHHDLSKESGLWPTASNEGSSWSPIQVTDIRAIALIARFMGPTWGRHDPGGPHVGPMNLVIWVGSIIGCSQIKITSIRKQTRTCVMSVLDWFECSVICDVVRM